MLLFIGLVLVMPLFPEVAHASAHNPSSHALGMWLFSARSVLGFFCGAFLPNRERGPHSHGR